MSDPQLKLVTNDLDADLAEIAAERFIEDCGDHLRVVHGLPKEGK
jgi:hypothetical protein